MGVRSLKRLAQEECMKNMAEIWDVGDVSYEALRPAMLTIKDPEQLRHIEVQCPQICGKDGEVWKRIVKKEIPKWKNKLREPKDPASWWKVFRNLKKEEELEAVADAKAMKAKLDGLQAERAAHTSRKVELDLVKAPKGLDAAAEVISIPKNTKFYDRLPGSDIDHTVREWEKRHGHIPGFSSNQYAKIKNPDGPSTLPAAKSQLAKFRKEAKSMSRFPSTARKANSLPSSKVIAPPALLEQYRKTEPSRPIDPTVPSPEKFNPKKRRIEHVQQSSSDDLEQREKRLKAIAHPSTTQYSLPASAHPVQPSTSSHPKNPPKELLHQSGSKNPLHRQDQRRTITSSTMSTTKAQAQVQSPAKTPPTVLNSKKRSIEHVEPSESTEAVEQREKRPKTLDQPLTSKPSMSPRPQRVRAPRLHRHSSSLSSISDMAAIGASASPVTTQSPAQNEQHFTTRPTSSSDRLREAANTVPRAPSPMEKIARRKRAAVNCFMPTKQRKVC